MNVSFLLFPKKQWFLLLLGILFLIIFAQISIQIPLSDSPIPITGQSFAVLVVGFLLGKRRGALAVVFYLLLGGVGLPIFAEGASGWRVLVGGSGGFLAGFVAAAYCAGFFGDKKWGAFFFKILFSMALATAVLLVFGVAWLTVLFGFAKALVYGFYPVLGGAAIKILLATTLVFFIQKNDAFQRFMA